MNPVFIAKTIEFIKRGYGSGDIKRYLMLDFGITDEDWEEIQKLLKNSGIEIKNKDMSYYINKSVRSAKYYKKHRKELLARWREYYNKTREERLAYAREYYQNNKEAIAIRKREYRSKNKEKIRDYWQKYYQANKDKKREYWKEYYLKNREKILQRRRERRAQLRKLKEQQKELVNGETQ